MSEQMSLTNYRPSRFVLLSWLNNLLNLDYIRIEQCTDGLAYAQILASLHPDGGIPLHLFNWAAESPWDCARNLMFVAEAVNRLDLPFEFDAEKLSKGRLLEHLQTLRSFYLYYHNKQIKPTGGRSRSAQQIITKVGGQPVCRKAPLGVAASVDYVHRTSSGGLLSNSRGTGVVCAKLFNDMKPTTICGAKEVECTDMIGQLQQHIQDKVHALSKAIEETEEVVREASFYFEKLNYIEEIAASSQSHLGSLVNQMLAVKPEQL
eukprot:GHVS01108897.1.p1 GENE.GHVS01108897.1~~GHVS01108897.1.p1  ORF type:complete len:263 (+),score=43.19 GHVS01108897.1:182-970(+)